MIIDEFSKVMKSFILFIYLSVLNGIINLEETLPEIMHGCSSSGNIS